MNNYVDRGTAHRCIGCGSSVHAKWNGKNQPEYICDKTNIPIELCGVVPP